MNEGCSDLRLGARIETQGGVRPETLRRSELRLGARIETRTGTLRSRGVAPIFDSERGLKLCAVIQNSPTDVAPSSTGRGLKLGCDMSRSEPAGSPRCSFETRIELWCSRTSEPLIAVAPEFISERGLKHGTTSDS